MRGLLLTGVGSFRKGYFEASIRPLPPSPCEEPVIKLRRKNRDRIPAAQCGVHNARLPGDETTLDEVRERHAPAVAVAVT